MAAAGPKPWNVRQARTLYLRIPRVDWAAIIAGQKTEFRAVGRHALLGAQLNPPCPVVAWTIREFGSHHEHVRQLMVLEDVRSEPLGAISQESLEREGFETLKEFRHYWRQYRTKFAYKPLSKVWVYRLRPWRGREDSDLFAARLLNHLYGEHAPA